MKTHKDCVFCKIVAGEIPAAKIYEDDDFIAFLDRHPRSPGHAQVIPKRHYRWVWDVPNAGSYFEIVKKIALAQRQAFGTDWVLCQIIGDEIPHAHIWVFPSNGTKGNRLDLEGNAKKLRAAL
jgi:histidine triad (HIT) family protein